MSYFQSNANLRQRAIVLMLEVMTQTDKLAYLARDEIMRRSHLAHMRVITLSQVYNMRMRAAR